MRSRGSFLLTERRQGGRLRVPNAREGEPITQEALGRKLGISNTYVSHLETGSRRPGRKLATALADIGGPDVADWERAAEEAA